MKCAKCDSEAIEGSNYCEDHQPSFYSVRKDLGDINDGNYGRKRDFENKSQPPSKRK